jgi:hypothetical protein
MIEWRKEQDHPYDELKHDGMAIAERFRSEWPKYPLAQMMSAQFYEAVDDEQEKADEAWRQTILIGGETFQWCAVGSLYRNRSTQVMLDLLDGLDIRESGWMRAARAYILADTTDGKSEAMSIFEDLTHEDASPMDLYTAIQIPLLLGEKELAIRRANEWLVEWDDDAGRESESDYNELNLLQIIASDGKELPELNDRAFNSLSNYLLGLLAIADGHREQAMHHLQLSVEGPYGWVDPYWARAIMEHLETDQAWPRGNPNTATN